ncbi:hypothetical protein B0T26DRAFT_73851 [Lasiosphaeria miniovina]|uniref:Uncharacterized protein n=1 Tax=Lasiosphaeria miniovina TaxID=1954250 RepID=A0AA40BHT0_9PEZI|nr:uncharacterized protein B0T26DRAFT_73851 [Lasiosphaeria miniovina]KAK0734490.1 hypothetical protein B0T26DRAFT_73851 [Lasiosphaeria miniovina]
MMALLKGALVLAFGLASVVVGGPLPAAAPVDVTPAPEESEPDAARPAKCNNWLPTVISGLTDDLATIAVCAPEPTELAQDDSHGARHDALDDLPTTTVTVTVTATPTASIVVPPAPEVVTVQRTYTVTAWTQTATIVETLNCTQTVLAQASQPPARATPPLLRRQTGSSTTTATAATPPPPAPKTPLPTSNATLPAPPPRPARTRTVWTVTTATQTGPLLRTRYQCDATVAYAFTVDKTATVLFTATTWAASNIVTTTSLLSCNAYGLGTPSLPTPAPAPPPPPAAASPAAAAAVKKRQGATASPTSASAVAASPAPGSTTVAGPTTSTIVVHLTRTTYSIVTIEGPGTSTRLTYACIPTPVAPPPPPPAVTTTSVSIIPAPPTTTTNPPAAASSPGA